MKRDIYNKPVTWKKHPRREPLILKGVRQVGKTSILQEFGKKKYENVAYSYAPRLPLAAYREDIFKLYLLDVGLLGTMIRISQRMVVQGSSLFSEFNGAFVENYAARELVESISIGDPCIDTNRPVPRAILLTRILSGK